MTKQEELKNVLDNLVQKEEKEFIKEINAYPELMTFKTEHGENIFLLACISGHFNVVNYLIEQGIDIYQKTNDGRNAIFYAACSSYISDKSSVELLKMLHNLNILIDEKDTSKNSPLLLAARYGTFDVIKFLIENGAAINHENEEGHFLLQLLNERYIKKDIPFLVKYFDQFNEKNQKILKKWRLNYVLENGSL